MPLVEACKSRDETCFYEMWEQHGGNRCFQCGPLPRVCWNVSVGPAAHFDLDILSSPTPEDRESKESSDIAASLDS